MLDSTNTEIYIKVDWVEIYGIFYGNSFFDENE